MSIKALPFLALITLCSACQPEQPAFLDVDADKNGAISAEEAKVAGIDIAKGDANQDGTHKQEKEETHHELGSTDAFVS